MIDQPNEDYFDDAMAGHHPSCCGACDTCFSVCPGYHGRERRVADRRRPIAELRALTLALSEDVSAPRRERTSAGKGAGS